MSELSRSMRGFTLLELLAVLILTAVVSIAVVPSMLDLSSAAKAGVQKEQDATFIANLSGAAQQNFIRGTNQTAGTRMGKWEFSCLAGNQIAQLLDNRDFEGGYGGMWFKNADGTPDFSRYWALGGTDTVSHSEVVPCTATRGGVTETFYLTGCTTWESCRCNVYPSDCDTF